MKAFPGGSQTFEGAIGSLWQSKHENLAHIVTASCYMLQSGAGQAPAETVIVRCMCSGSQKERKKLRGYTGAQLHPTRLQFGPGSGRDTWPSIKKNV